MTGPVRIPEAGDVLYVCRAASVQFVAPIRFRVIRPQPWETYHGWIWLDGYELSASGDAVKRRSIFVQPVGLRWITVDVARPRVAAPRPARSAPRPSPG